LTHPEAIKAFLAAIEQAVEQINANSEQYTDLMSENGLLPPPLIGNYQVNPFPAASVPSQAQWDDAVAWAIEKGLIEHSVDYQNAVTSAYLP